jgi:hypothetical protein
VITRFESKQQMTAKSAAIAQDSARSRNYRKGDHPLPCRLRNRVVARGRHGAGRIHEAMRLAAAAGGRANGVLREYCHGIQGGASSGLFWVLWEGFDRSARPQEFDSLAERFWPPKDRRFMVALSAQEAPPDTVTL